MIAVKGANAAAVFGGDLTGTVTEDGKPNAVSGTTTLSDSDGADRRQAQTDAAGTYGHLHECHDRRGCMRWTT